jgi:RimJ/RimL family protein N-acetyltransferase
MTSIAQTLPPISGILKTTTSSLVPPFYRIEVFTQTDLLQQSFLAELREVINSSYQDPGDVPFEKMGSRLRSETQLTDELKSSGFIAIAFVQNTIIGTACVKKWDSYSEGGVWKPPGHFDQFSAEEVFFGSSAVLNSINESPNVICEGEYELTTVALKPGPEYRGKGIAENMVRACEEELKNRMLPAKITGVPHPMKIMLRSIRESKGPYWRRKGFRIVGEQYCPALTWDFDKAFVLWAMEKELTLN